MTAKKENSADFKQAMHELEEINLWFQQEEIDLDEGLVKLKRAKELLAVCRGKLVEVENEFNVLKHDIAKGNESSSVEVQTQMRAEAKPTLDELPF